jgi:peptide/nickel transport system ATP-binding protein
MLRRVGIAGPERVARSFPHQLSGGMCQRVMIGLSVGINPALLIADEPTTGLDVTIQAQILELIGEMQAETGASVLLITHDLGVVAEICQRVAVMYAGRVVEIAPANTIFDHPRHPYTVRLLKASLALESPEKESVTDAAEVVEITTSAALTVGDNVYRASLESAEDPDSGAEMIEVAPNHVVLCTREQREEGAPSEVRSGEAGAIS